VRTGQSPAQEQARARANTASAGGAAAASPQSRPLLCVPAQIVSGINDSIVHFGHYVQCQCALS
jgi:hypothetical protein